MSDLRTKLALLFCEEQNGPWPECMCGPAAAARCEDCQPWVDRVLTLVRPEVLEEAAHIAPPGFDTVVHVDGSYSDGWLAGVRAMQAAIRALKEGKR